MRGHAMFSAEERTLDEETLEYAWLVELTIGTLSGKLTTPQVESSVSAHEAIYSYAYLLGVTQRAGSIGRLT